MKGVIVCPENSNQRLITTPYHKQAKVVEKVKKTSETSLILKTTRGDREREYIYICKKNRELSIE